MGASAALIYPATLALLSSTFTDRRERATAIGIWSAVTGLAVAIGPVSGGLLLQHFSWSSVLWVNVPLAVLALVAGWRLLPQSRDLNPGRFDPVGAVGSIVAIGALVWTTIEAPSNGWASWPTIGGYAVAAAALAAFVLWEARRPDPLLDVRLFANPRFSAASGSVAMAFFGLFGFIFLITQYFQVVRGYDTLQAGVATLPFAVVVGACSPVSIMVMRRVGTKLVVAGGLVTMAAGFVVAAGSSVDSPYWGRVVLAMILMAAGLAFVSSPATEAIMGALPPAQAGAGSAVNDTVREVGGTLGVAVVGSVMSTLYAPHVVESLRELGVSASLADRAADSIGSGMEVASSLPASAVGPAVGAVRDAFMDGVAAGSYVAAAACAVGALAALFFLPRAHRAAPVVVPFDLEQLSERQLATVD
jgi:EmrB/QacA subfamily drug resistance transporter